MAISDETRRIALSVIKINREQRQRAELKDIDKLASSIAKNGLIHPIVIDRDWNLIAGERRLMAHMQLGWPDILCRFSDSLDEREKQIIELEENIKRSDLDWMDLVKSMARIHGLYCQLDHDWTMSETAENCNVEVSLVSMYLRIHREMEEGNERVIEAGTVNEAYNIIRRRDQRAAGDALAELIEPITPVAPPPAGGGVATGGIGGLPPPAARPHQITLPGKVVVSGPPGPDQTILNEDFLRWAPQYEGPKFNFLHCDFPYGIDVFSGPQARGTEPSKGYDDQKGLYENLIKCLCENLNRIMSISGHVMFWYSDKHRQLTLNMFNRLAPSLDIHPYPLIWVKSDNAGIAADPRQGPRHIYETALFMTRGKRQIVRIKSDAYVAPTDKTLHPSTKPEPMLRHFFEMLVDDHTTMFDPTCGSGASIRAAESCGASATLGLEIDEQFVRPARHALHMARLKAAASARAG